MALPLKRRLVIAPEKAVATPFSAAIAAARLRICGRRREH